MSLFNPVLLFIIYKRRDILEIKLLRFSSAQEKSGEDIFIVYFENQVSISIRTTQLMIRIILGNQK